MPAPRVWPRDHRSPKLSRPPSPAAHDRTAPSRPAPVRILLPTAARRLRDGRRTRPSPAQRSEEHTSELQSLMRISYAVFCLKKKKHSRNTLTIDHQIHSQIPHMNSHHIYKEHLTQNT